MPDYILRDVDDATWQRFKARAARDGHSLRWVLLRLVERYANDAVFIGGAEPPTALVARLDKKYGRGRYLLHHKDGEWTVDI